LSDSSNLYEFARFIGCGMPSANSITSAYPAPSCRAHTTTSRQARPACATAENRRNRKQADTGNEAEEDGRAKGWLDGRQCDAEHGFERARPAGSRSLFHRRINPLERS